MKLSEQNKENLFINFLLIISTIITFIPFFEVGFTTSDDFEYYLTSHKDMNSILADADIYARTAGRFFFLITKPLYLIPYIFDNFYFTKIVQYLFLLLSYFTFSYLIYKIFNSAKTGKIVFLMLICSTAITFNFHIPTIAYPFFFSFSFTLCMLGILLFIKYIESQKYKYAIWGGIIFFISLLFYETYLIFLLFFCIYILVRNIKKFGIKKIWKEKIFYKEILPFAGAGILYTALYFGYRIIAENPYNTESFYDGSSFVKDFSFKNFCLILTKCTRRVIPGATVFLQSGDFATDTLLIGGHYNKLSFILTHAQPIAYINAMIVGLIFILFFKKESNDLTWKKIIYGIIFSIIAAFSAHILIGIADKYNREWASWMGGYVTSFYSYFFIISTMVLFAMLFDKICKKIKILRYGLCIIFTGGIMILSILVSYSNNNLSREWIRSQNRVRVIDEMISEKYFENIPDKSIIFNKDIYHTTQWGKQLCFSTVPHFDAYINMQTEKNYSMTADCEEFVELIKSNPNEEVYVLETGESIKACEMMLSISKLNKDSISLDSTKKIKFQAISSDIFYYSPTKDYVLMYNSRIDGQAIYNSKDSVNIVQGLNAINIINKNKNRKLTKVSIQAENIDPESISIMNMMNNTLDTLYCE